LHKVKRAEQDVDEPPPPPTLFVTEKGKTTQEMRCDKPRLLIGRSEHNDLTIDSRFVSRHHMLLVRHGSATFLMDLNSTNGTYVNSRRVSNQVLIDNDIITVGNHRLKFCDPHAKRRDILDGAEFADTVIMKTLDDMRDLLSQENTAIMPSLTENVPTHGR
jgi:predicted component of type VI protein secretion system